uniref:Uncharacterized protein n=1 Tax=Kuenenia stuttgartiensis TaxID=174633 RepID=Q1Q695_KUEST|nr:unknown protein [Candidatus Kuenenia stuttgartiensis]
MIASLCCNWRVRVTLQDWCAFNVYGIQNYCCPKEGYSGHGLQYLWNTTSKRKG